MAGRWTPIKKRSFSLRRGGLHGLICIREAGVWVLCEAVCVIKSGGAAFKRCCIIQFSSTSTSKQHVVCWSKWCCRSYAPLSRSAVDGSQTPESCSSDLSGKPALWLCEMSGSLDGPEKHTQYNHVIPYAGVLYFKLKYMFFQPLYRSPSDLNIDYGSRIGGIWAPAATLGLKCN